MSTDLQHITGLPKKKKKKKHVHFFDALNYDNKTLLSQCIDLMAISQNCGLDLSEIIWPLFDASYNKPSASRAISCRRPVVPRSMPVLSSSSLSKNELAVDESERSVTCPTFIGRPASSKPFSCSRAFFAHSASANLKKNK